MELKGEDGNPLVNFGVQKEQRDEEVSKLFKANGPLWKLDSTDDVSENGTNGSNGSNGTNGANGHSGVPKTKAAPTVKDITGISLPYIGTYKKMDNIKQVVALIDDVRCFCFLFF